MPRFLAALILAVALPASSYPAEAQRLIRVQGPPLRQACFTDYMKFCRGVPLGGGRAINCLNENANQLSQRCFQALTVRGLAYAGALKSCRADYERLCAGVAPGWGRSLQCMRNSAPMLSPGCREALKREGFLDGGDSVP
jgi:hypothetical protein